MQTEWQRATHGGLPVTPWYVELLADLLALVLACGLVLAWWLV